MGGSDIEHNKNVGEVPTIMRPLTCKDGDFLSHFVENDESEAVNGNTSLKHHLVNNHGEDATLIKLSLKDNYH